MNAPLYSIDILRLAAETALTPRLDGPDASAERRTRTCGSRILLDIRRDAAGQVAACGFNINACALGQASAAVMARNIVGQDAAALVRARDAMAAWISGASEAMPDWPGIEVLGRARAYPARHAAILLPFEAAVEAMVQ